MAQKPIIKDGIVINVIEIDETTQVVTKAQYKEAQVADEANYNRQLEIWRAEMRQRRANVEAALTELGMARATVAALKVTAGNETDDARAALILRQILVAERDIAAIEKNAKMLQTSPISPKPTTMRGKYWFHPDDMEIGPDGGNIGDVWNGEKYVQSATTKPNDQKADSNPKSE